MGWLNIPDERFLVCNAASVRYFRNRRDWTQQELADAAGYKLRAIVKTERNESVKRETIADVAEALSTENEVVHPEDLVVNPGEMAAAYHRAVCRYEGKAASHMQHLLSDELELFIPGGPKGKPLTGRHVGPEGLHFYLSNFFKIFERPDKEEAERNSVSAGQGNRAVVACFEKIVNELIPQDVLPCPLTMYFTISRGKFRTIQYVFDSEAFCEVVSKWQENHPGIVDVDRTQMLPWSGDEDDDA